jgi:chromosome segregation ATPase
MIELLTLGLLVALILLTIHRDRQLERRHGHLTLQLHDLRRKVDHVTTQNDRLTAALATINTATNNIAADLRALKAKIAEGQVDETVLAGIEAAATQLDAVAAETPDEPPTS